MISKKINVLAIGFNFQEINCIQDELNKVFTHFNFDFAISIRDSWYRLKFTDYDYLLVDLTDSDLDSIIATQEIAHDAENITIIASVEATEIPTISNALNLQKSYFAIKDSEFAVNLVDSMRAVIEQPQAKRIKQDSLAIKQSPVTQQIINAIDDRVIIVGMDYKIHDLNKAMLKALDQSEPDVIGAPCYQACYKFSEPCHKKGLPCPLLSLEQDDKDHCNMLHVHKNAITEIAKRIEISATKIAVANSENAEIMIVSKGVPIEQAPFGDFKLLESLINGISDGIFLCDSNGTIVLHNHMVEKLFGKERNYFVGKAITELPANDASSWLNGIMQNVKSQVHTTSNIKIQIKNKWLLLRYVPLYHQSNDYLGGFLYLSDISTTHIIDAHHQEIDRELFKITKFFPAKFIAEG